MDFLAPVLVDKVLYYVDYANGIIYSSTIQVVEPSSALYDMVFQKTNTAVAVDAAMETVYDHILTVVAEKSNQIESIKYETERRRQSELESHESAEIYE